MCLKQGDKVKFKKKSAKELSGYSFWGYNNLKENKVYKVDRIKGSGGVILEDVDVGYNMFGEEQGIKQHHFTKVKKKKLIKKKK